MAGCRRTRGTWGALVAVFAVAAAPALGQDVPTPPPTPSPSPPASAAAPEPSPAPAAAAQPTAAELLERFQRMEQLNQKLLQEVNRLAEQNRQLADQVQDLNKRVAGPDGSAADTAADPKAAEAAKADAKKKEGLANALADGVTEESAESGFYGSARSSGLRLLPNAQVKGNRQLGKIPLKAFYDYGRDGVGLESEDQEFQLKFRAELQADSMLYTGAPQTYVHSGFYLPRVRYYFQGRYTKPIEYQLSFQRSYSSFGFLNVFANFNYDPRFQVRVGRFKVPFTYEWYKLNNFRFIAPERPMFAANFGLNRMAGSMLWGVLAKERVEYAVGVFDGARNSLDEFNSSKDVVAFLNTRPFAQTDGPLKNLNVGGSLDYGVQDNPLLPAALRTNSNGSATGANVADPQSHATLPFLVFNNNVVEKGVRQLYDLHLAYYYQGLSFIGGWGSGYDSYAVRNQNPLPMSVSGWNVTAAYLLTGETLEERTVIDPIRRFDLRRGRFGLGAFEPFVRYSELEVSQDVFTRGLADPNLWTNRAQLVDIGMNWYINRAVKVYFDWQHAMFGDPIFAQSTPAGPVLQKNNNLLWVRVQVYF